VEHEHDLGEGVGDVAFGARALVVAFRETRCDSICEQRDVSTVREWQNGAALSLPTLV
jgi:hypothetical protein